MHWICSRAFKVSTPRVKSARIPGFLQGWRTSCRSITPGSSHRLFTASATHMTGVRAGTGGHASIATASCIHIHRRVYRAILVRTFTSLDHTPRPRDSYMRYAHPRASRVSGYPDRDYGCARARLSAKSECY